MMRSKYTTYECQLNKITLFSRHISQSQSLKTKEDYYKGIQFIMNRNCLFRIYMYINSWFQIFKVLQNCDAMTF